MYIQKALMSRYYIYLISFKDTNDIYILVKLLIILMKD